MREESLIKCLYDHFDENNLGFKPDTKEYEKACRAREDAYNNLMAVLPEGVDKLFESYFEKDSYASLLEEKEIYRQGVCLGVKFIIEAFEKNKNRWEIKR